MKYYFSSVMVILLFFSNAQSLDSLYKLGVQELENENYKVADSILSKCIDLSNNNKGYLFPSTYNRGLARMYSNNLCLAKKDFEVCLKLNKNDYETITCMAECLLYLNDYYESMQYVDRAISIDSKKLDVYVIGIFSSLKVLEFQKGIDYCSKAIKQNREARFYSMRSMLFLAKGDNISSLQDIKECEKYFGSEEVNLIEAKIYYYYKMDNLDVFTELVKNLNAKNSKYVYFMSLEKDFLSDINKTISLQK